MSQDGVLEIEPDRNVAEITCDDCGEPFQRVTGFVCRDGDAHAVYFASYYHHDGQEAFIDAVFSRPGRTALMTMSPSGAAWAPSKIGTSRVHRS